MTLTPASSEIPPCPDHSPSPAKPTTKATTRHHISSNLHPSSSISQRSSLRASIKRLLDLSRAYTAGPRSPLPFLLAFPPPLPHPSTPLFDMVRPSPPRSIPFHLALRRRTRSTSSPTHSSQSDIKRPSSPEPPLARHPSPSRDLTGPTPSGASSASLYSSFSV